MLTIILLALLTLASIANAGGTTHCTTRYDGGLKLWRSECSDGSRAITRWDAGLRRYYTDVTKAPKDGMPHDWPTPAKPPSTHR